jgi:hypothetical protein
MFGSNSNQCSGERWLLVFQNEEKESKKEEVEETGTEGGRRGRQTTLVTD